MKRIKLAIAAALCLVSFINHAAVVAVVGSRSELTTIQSAFANLGDTVVRYNQDWNNLSSVQLDDIFNADIIWEGTIFSGLSSNVQSRMSDFVNADKGLMLTAERSCCETKNNDIETIARALTGDANLEVGGFGTDLFGHTFSNSPTTILTGPHDIRGQVVQMNGPGQVSPTGGVNSNACFVSSENDTVCTAAAWGADELVNNFGRLIIYGDINSQPGLVNEFQGQQFENMREFLLSGLSGGIDVCIENPNLPGCEDVVVSASAPASIAGFGLLILFGSFLVRKRA